MPDPFYSPKRTLERAKYHFRDFEARVSTFANNKQGTYFIERDIKGRDNRHVIRFDKTFFDEAPSIVFDIINNLRAVLDHAVFASCTASKRPVTQFAYFPFTKAEQFLAKRINGLTKEAPDEVQAIITSFKPYKGGNVALWNLNRLCNSKKHTILMPIATEGLTVHLGSAGGIMIGLSHTWSAEKYEIEITGAGGADFSYAHSFSFRIAFDDTETWVGHSEPLAVLSAMVREVQRFLVRIEAECRQLWPESFS
jgi:hypothetical protein